MKNKNVLLILALLFMGLTTTAFAEVAVIKAPLVWYAGGSGDYALPKLENSEYDLSGFVATAGQVTTLCVNYDFVGKVAVEVSADNGLHYYPVTNGVPLADNFISGDRIRWQAKVLDEDSKLNTLTITYTDSSGVIADFGQAKISGFNYRKEILLKNPSGQELYNYQINLKVGIDKKTKGADVNCEGQARADFFDVRFTAADGETPLAYYLDSRFRGNDGKGSGDEGEGKAAGNDGLGSFWVKVPQIPVEGVKIYIYYGNSLASNLSDPKNTFDFYDDFKSAKLDADVWEVKTDPKGSAVIKDGQLKLDAAEIIAKNFKFKQGIIEYALSIESGFENSLNLRAKSGELYDNPSLVVYSSAYKGAEQCIAINDIVQANAASASPIAAGGKYNYRLTVNDKDITFERIDQTSTSAPAKVAYSNLVALPAGYPGLKSGGDGSGRNVIAYSGIRARKFADKVPQVNKSGAAEQVKLPIFSNIAFSEKGNLVLNDNTKEGIYISKTIPAEFTARIIRPTFKGANAGVSVSADNGVNYKEDCASGNYYYASLKDFVAGAQIAGKIKLTPAKDKSGASEFTELKLDYNPGTILIVKPNGAEILNAGESSDILWSASGYDPAYPIKLEYSLNNGKTYREIIAGAQNKGSYAWLIPQDVQTQSALVRASDSNAAEINDVSDKVFTIQIGNPHEIPASAGMTGGSAGMTQESVGTTQESAGMTEKAVAEAEASQEAVKQAKLALSDVGQDYLIDANVTISTKKDLAFKTLTLGDGTGKNVSRLILYHNINPASGDIIIRKGGELVQANSRAQEISGDLLIQQGGIFTHLENKNAQKYQLDLTAKNITLRTGAIVSAYAKGYNGGEARHAGAGKAGGLYKGKGVSGGRHSYDTARVPKELGSGGAGSGSAKGGAGGGVIRLVAKSEFSLSGIINADGKAGEVSADNTYNAAGGAGGSIYLEANKFSGSGTKITATGGSGNKTGGAGGGGRINIKAPLGRISGTINANGGSGKDASAGSVIVE